MRPFRASGTSHEASVIRRQYLHSFVAAACIGPFLSYVLADLGWSPRDIGYATAVLTASAVASAPLWGWIDDARSNGAARLSLVATAIAALTVAAAVAGTGRGPALAAIALLGACSGSLEPLLTARALRNASTASGLGAVRSLGSVGWILGLGVGGLLLTVANQQPALIFLLAGAAALSAPVLRAPEVSSAHVANADLRTAEGPPPSDARTPQRGGLPVRAVLGVLSMTFPVPLCMAGLVFFTAGWAHSSLGAGPLLAVGPLALSAALELPAFLLVDRLGKRVSSTWLCGAAFVPLALATVLLALFPGKVTIFAVQPLVAASFALWFVGHSRLMSERVSRRQLASALTLLSTLGRGIAGPIAGMAGGALAAVAGYPMLFLAMSILCVLGLVRVALAALWAPAA
ncbi:MFS transporter [Arthrobacter subterraneus]|uniref:MFS transporter n=1 Tax=Arthrobacter subterraneus TaxID=335973 RepID=UPI0038262ECF